MTIRPILAAVLALALLAGCGDSAETPAVTDDAADSTAFIEAPAVTPALLQIVTIKSALTEDELLTIAKDRAAQFRELPGLIQKYYVRLGDEGTYGGFYLWESREAMEAFRASDLAATMPEAYKLVEPPKIEVHEVMFQLRE